MATLGWLKTIFGLVSNYNGHMTNPVDAANDALTTVGVLCTVYCAICSQLYCGKQRAMHREKQRLLWWSFLVF